METFALTHTGYKRKHNEDRCFLKQFSEDTCIMAVADGMGGQVGGALASQVAIKILKDYDPSSGDIESRLGGLIQTSHSEILKITQGNPDLRGMGTTMTIAYIQGDSIHWAHVGDSRLHFFHSGSLIRITEDHTVPGFLVKKNKITEEEARTHHMKHMLLKCVGCKVCEPETGHFKGEPGDVLLISSDGMHDEVAADEIFSILSKEQTTEQKLEILLDSALQYGEIPPDAIISILKTHQTLKQKIQALVNSALKAGGSDNITVVGAEL